jgi:hypothetical protein
VKAVFKCSLVIWLQYLLLGELLHRGRLIQKILSSEELLIASLVTVLHRVDSINFSQELWLSGEYHIYWSFSIFSSISDTFVLNIEETVAEISSVSTSANGNCVKTKNGSSCLMS